MASEPSVVTVTGSDRSALLTDLTLRFGHIELVSEREIVLPGGGRGHELTVRHRPFTSELGGVVPPPPPAPTLLQPPAAAPEPAPEPPTQLHVAPAPPAPEPPALAPAPPAREPVAGVPTPGAAPLAPVPDPHVAER